MNNEAQKRSRGQVKQISRVTWVGFWVNLFISAFKITAGIMGNSRAVVADGIHSLSDQFTDIAILVGVHFWTAPPDQEHHYGHKRLESMISLGLGLVLAVVAIGIAWDAIARLNQTEKTGSPLALVAALSSIVVKELLYHWTIRKGRELKSPAVIANAWHHRTDAFSSIPIAITVGVVLWLPDLAFLDPVGAIVVSIFIIYASWNVCRPSIDVLLDKGASRELHQKIKAFALTQPEIKQVHQLRSRYLGQGITLDMHVCVDPDMTIRQADEIVHRLETAFYSDKASELFNADVLDAVIHVDPWTPSKNASQS